jgi:hypothetical protein
VNLVTATDIAGSQVRQFSWGSSDALSTALGTSDELWALAAPNAYLYRFGRDSLSGFGLRVKVPFGVLVKRPAEGNFIASFLAAGAHASGDTRMEALSNLKDTISHLFWRLNTLSPSKMARSAQEQLTVLARHIASA